MATSPAGHTPAMSVWLLRNKVRVSIYIFIIWSSFLFSLLERVLKMSLIILLQFAWVRKLIQDAFSLLKQQQRKSQALLTDKRLREIIHKLLQNTTTLETKAFCYGKQTHPPDRPWPVYLLVLTFSSCSSANFFSCILKPKFGLAMSLQNLTTASDSSIPSDDTHITYKVVMVTERDIPAALQGSKGRTV